MNLRVCAHEHVCVHLCVIVRLCDIHVLPVSVSFVLGWTPCGRLHQQDPDLLCSPGRASPCLALGCPLVGLGAARFRGPQADKGQRKVAATGSHMGSLEAWGALPPPCGAVALPSLAAPLGWAS